MKKKTRGFTLIELMIVIVIIAMLAAIAVPGLQVARESGRRATCANNMKQIGLGAINYESANAQLPRSGEHFATDPGGVIHKAQCLQSPLTLILPFIERDIVYKQYDIKQRHNEGNNASAAAVQKGPGAVIPTFLCPTNPERQNPRDSAGYGCTDYACLPYVEINAGNSALSGIGNPSITNRLPSAMTADAYPQSFYKDYGSPSAPDVEPAKCYHLLESTNLPASFNVRQGGSKLAAITDGTAYAILFYEDTGRNDTMNGSDGAGGFVAKDYLDPVTGQGRAHWRWAEPDSSSGCSGLMNNKNLPHSVHDFGNNNEWFSFHPGGAHAVFGDGHAQFISENISLKVVYSLGTRSNGSDTGNGPQPGESDVIE